MDKFYFSVDFPDNKKIEKIYLEGTFPIPDVSYKNGWTPFTTKFHYYADKEKYKFHDEFVMPLLSNLYSYGAEFFKDPMGNWESMKGKLGKALLEINEFDFYEIDGVWLHSINFGDLCYSSDPEFDIEVTWRFLNCRHIRRGNMSPIKAHNLI